MGGNQSSASITQENNVITVNKSVVELLSTQINKTTSDTIINLSTSCAATANTTLMALFQNITAAGDINIDNTMNNKVTVNISCVNSSTIGSSVGTQVSSDMSAQLITAFQNMADQASAGQATAITGSSFDPFGGLMKNASATDIKQLNTATTTNDTKTVVQSVIENIVATTLTASVMNELKTSVISQMAVTFKNLQAGGNVNITNLMDSTTAIIASQVTQMNIGNQVTQKLLSTFGVQVQTTAENTSVQTTKAEAESSAISTGLGGLFSGLFGGLFSGSPGSSTISSLCCCCCCIVLILFLLKSLVGGGDDE